MERHSQVGPPVRFGPFELDVRSAELQSNGRKILLHEQSFQVLLALLERPGELISREELVQRLWPDGTLVDYERGLNKAVNKLRNVLRDSADSPRFVETIPRRGYRFIAPLEGRGTLIKAEDAALAGVAIPPTEDLAKSHAPQVARWRKFAVVGVLTAVAVVTYLGWRHFEGQKTLQSRKIMLAVLPFENLSGDPEEEYFSAGMTEEMIAQLGSLQPERLGVIARASSMIYKSSKKGMDQIGKELRVDYVLESSVRRSGGRVRITAQLIQVSDQTHVWAQSYDRDLRDVLAVQGDVARAIANEIEVKLPAPADRRLTRPRPLNQEAYEDYLKGKYFLSKCCEENWAKSGPYFEHAIEKDPDYAPAYAGLANYYSTVPARPGDIMTKAETAARKALALDDTLADAHVAMARVELYYRWDWVAAERELRRSLELNPSDPDAHHVYSDYLAVMGRVEESAAEMRRAGDLDPLWAQLRYELGAGLSAIGRYDEAIAAYRKALELDPGFAQAHQGIGEAFEKKGMYKESMEEWQTALTLEGDNDTASLLQRTYISSGFGEAKKTVLQKQIQQLKERSKREYVGPGEFAYCYAKINDKDQAFAWLEKAYEEREWSMPFLKILPMYENLRPDPRLAELARRVGIP